MSELRNRYLNCLTPDREPVAWRPPEVPDGVLADSLYFGEVLAEMDARLRRGDLTVYLTQDLERLPSYGPGVVAIVIGDEKAAVPRYADRVAAVFKNNAVRPLLTTSVLREPSWINLWWYVSYLRLWRHHAPGAARWLRSRVAPGARAAPVWLLPVGTFNQVDLPLKPFDERRTDVFFAGSVSHHRETPPLKDRIAPKVLSRSAMADSAGRLARARPDLAVEVVDTGAFKESMSAPGLAYSEALMDARIALVPRGVIADTFRFWQALRAGCVVVTDTLPRGSRLYDGAPVVRVGRWEELEVVVPELLADPARLRDLHERSVGWWATRGAPAAVGAHMAARLDALASCAP